MSIPFHVSNHSISSLDGLKAAPMVPATKPDLPKLPVHAFGHRIVDASDNSKFSLFGKKSNSLKRKDSL